MAPAGVVCSKGHGYIYLIRTLTINIKSTNIWYIKQLKLDGTISLMIQSHSDVGKQNFRSNKVGKKFEENPKGSQRGQIGKSLIQKWCIKKNTQYKTMCIS